jgi:hypothetical protein
MGGDAVAKVDQMAGPTEAAGADLAVVEDHVSNNAWVRFPGLKVAIERWAVEAGPEAADILVSAMVNGMDSIEIRVSRLQGRGGEPADWIGWGAPMIFRNAPQAVIDHLAHHAMADGVLKMRSRDGLLRGGISPTPPDRRVTPIEGEVIPMPKATETKTAEAKPKNARKLPAPAAEPEPEPAKKKPGRPAKGAPGSKATTRATAPKMETRSAGGLASKVKGRKPAAKSKGKGSAARP